MREGFGSDPGTVGDDEYGGRHQWGRERERKKTLESNIAVSTAAARWLTAGCSRVGIARRGHRSCAPLAAAASQGARRQVRGAVRGAILVRQSHFESRHGRIAATCWISNCVRTALNSRLSPGHRPAFCCVFAAFLPITCGDFEKYRRTAGFVVLFARIVGRLQGSATAP